MGICAVEHPYIDPIFRKSSSNTKLRSAPRSPLQRPLKIIWTRKIPQIGYPKIPQIGYSEVLYKKSSSQLK